MTVEFSRHIAETPPAILPAGLVKPAAAPGSFVEFLNLTTPGGAVMAQTMIVILVYSMFLLKAPSTPWGIIMTALVLILTPWVPVLFGYGSTMAAGIVLVNVAAASFSYKAFVARTES